MAAGLLQFDPAALVRPDDRPETRLGVTMKLRYLLAFPAMALLSCDPISEDECRGGDWHERGFADGRAGRSVSILERYAEICGEFGISPAREIYLAARQSGLQLYCTPANAYEIGRDGDRINAVCTLAQARAMEPAFRHGRRYHEIDTDMADIEQRISELKDAIAALPAEPTAAQLDEVRRMRREIRDLDHDLFRLSIDKRRYASWP